MNAFQPLNSYRVHKALGKICAMFILLFSPFCIDSPVSAQFQKWAHTLEKVRYRVSVLQTEPELRFLPKYHGTIVFRKVITMQIPGRSGCSYNLQYDVVDDCKKVTDWYREALIAQGWKIRPDSSPPGNQIVQHDNLMITARRSEDGISCVVIPNPSYKKGYKTDLSVRYIDFPPEIGTHFGAQKTAAAAK